MLGTTLIKNWRVRESTSRSSDANLKAIADGADFCFRFRGMTVLRRYFGHENEKLATYGEFPDHSADTVITRNGDNILVHFNMLRHLRSCGYIDTDKMISGQFEYRTDGGAEVLELHPSLKTGNVSSFFITKTNGEIIASMIFAPDGLEGDYYYLFVFTSPE